MSASIATNKNHWQRIQQKVNSTKRYGIPAINMTDELLLTSLVLDVVFPDLIPVLEVNGTFGTSIEVMTNPYFLPIVGMYNRHEEYHEAMQATSWGDWRVIRGLLKQTGYYTMKSEIRLLRY